MATIVESTINQTSYESRNWTADFSPDLPSGGTVTSGTAYHTPPAGGTTLTPTITVSNPYVSALIANPDKVGIHYITIVATFSNNETSEERVAFAVGYDSTQARAGMTAIIRRLRGMAAVGAVDYEIAGVPYWSDAQLQEILDENRFDFFERDLTPIPQTVSGGSVRYTRFESAHQNLETYNSGSAIFALQLNTGAHAGTGIYSVDYNKGIIDFTTDQSGTVWMLSGRSYDLYNAAGDVWSQKAAYYAMSYDVKTDGHDLRRSQLQEQALKMEEYYRSLAGVNVVQMERSDTL